MSTSMEIQLKPKIMAKDLLMKTSNSKKNSKLLFLSYQTIKQMIKTLKRSLWDQQFMETQKYNVQEINTFW